MSALENSISTVDQRRATGKPRIRLRTGHGYKFIERMVSDHQLHTVCEEARCPNIFECWDRKTATIMILGDTCTRSCGFCSVRTGRPGGVDELEPVRAARAVKRMGLRHVVITSVDRDDLKEDFGARIWAETIRQIHNLVPDCTVEVLTPDFQGFRPALDAVFDAGPEIFSHNVECVERISKKVRAQADWNRSLNVLKYAVDSGMLTKTGLMVGLGETRTEVLETMEQVAALGVKIFTVGQYLQPTKDHLAVERYVSDDEFSDYRNAGLNVGFDVVESGPLVRSSYHADEQARLMLNKEGKNE